MRIRLPIAVRLTLAFAAVAVLPTVGVAVVAERLVARRYQADFAASLDAAEREVRREYERSAADVTQAVRRVARGDDPVVGQLLLDLAKGALDEEQERALQRRVSEQMRAVGLDAYALFDGRGTVLAAAHFPGRVGEVDEAVATRAIRHSGRPLLVTEAVIAGGARSELLMIEVTQPVQTDYGRAIVLGGRALRGALLDRLRLPARLLGERGEVLVTTAGGFPDLPSPRRVVALPSSATARVEIAAPDGDLQRALSWIRAAAMIIAGASLCLALLLGALLAARLARPLGELSAAALRVAAGDLSSTVAVGRNDEIGDLAAAWNLMIHDLADTQRRLLQSERVAAWREIARRIAHEVKNPLTPIQMSIETLGRVRRSRPELFDEVFEETSRTILDEVARLKHLATEFSDFARLPEPRLSELDARELVEGALGLYAGQEPAITRRYDDSLPRLRGDREQLQQVLRNLLENARDAVAQGGAIEVEVRRAGASLEIAVRDHGPGLSAAAKQALFTPYFTTKPHGTGLGLAIVHRIVADHGGDVRVDSQPGHGATFTVRLPLPVPPGGAGEPTLSR